MARTVSSPDGNRWYVRRVWLPWRPKWRGKRDLDLTDSTALDAAPGCSVDGLDDIFVVVGIVIAVVLFFVFVWPVLLVILELTLLAVLVVLGVLVRVVLRRPWIVEATPATGPGRFRWKVVGWRRSGEVVEEVARRLEHGRPLDPLPGTVPG